MTNATMFLKNEVLDLLDQTGYSIKEENILTEGPRNLEYTQLVSTLIQELCIFHNLQDVAAVHPLQNPDEADTFILELTGFLREYGCVHITLLEGSLADRLKTEQQRLILLQYLLSELQATRILVSVNKLEEEPQKVKPTETKETRLLSGDYSAPMGRRIHSISPKAALVLKFRRAATAVGLALPPPGSGKIQAPQNIFQGFIGKVDALLKVAPQGHLGKALYQLKKPLTDQQWTNLEKLMELIQHEYTHRKNTLIKRFDVTLQSFKWSPKAKKQMDAICKVIQGQEPKFIRHKEPITVAHVLAARDIPLLLIHRTSSGEARELSACALNKVLMGSVPDRGGRAWEMEAPPPEMPSFQKRQDDFRGGRGGGTDFHRGGGGGGEYHRGGGGGGGEYHRGGGGGGGEYHRGGGGGEFHRGGGGGGEYHRGGGGDSHRGRGGGDQFGGRGGYQDHRGGGRGGGQYSQQQQWTDTGYMNGNANFYPVDPRGGGFYDSFGGYRPHPVANYNQGMEFRPNPGSQRASRRS